MGVGKLFGVGDKFLSLGMIELGIFKQLPKLNEEWHVGSLTAEEANLAHPGLNPPYGGTRARDIILARDREFVRVYSSENREVGRWIMRSKEIEVLTPEQIRNKFALPSIPKYISNVIVPAETPLRLGTVATQLNWGSGGAIQYELKTELELSAYHNRRLIDEILIQKQRFNS